jgi:glycerate kinase
MKIIIAPDSFKGSLSAFEVIDCIRERALKAFPDAGIKEVPIADGGDGTVAALVHAANGRTIETTARDPLGRIITCRYGDVSGTAVIGMSEASGLALLKDSERNPLETSSHGTGDMIKKALDDGFKDILIGIGGSATNDGGTGAMQALGMSFFREDGSEISRMCGAELESIARIDDSAMDKRLKDTRITVMCDVTNPLTGPNGATYVYGPQKGGTPDILDRLENGMKSYASLLNAWAGYGAAGDAGAGAAGGIGAALHVFAGAQLCRGIEAVLDLVRFDELLKDTDVVITGEGRVDSQSACGKVIHGIAQRAKAAGVPVVVIAGSVGEGAQAVYPLGINAIVPLPDAPMTLEHCIQNASELMRQAADRVFSLIGIGRSLK